MEQVRGTWVLPLDAPGATADQVGGKAASLARLAAAGLPVPGGFLVTTDAYRRFLEDNALEPLVREAVATDDPGQLARAAQTLREALLRGTMPADLAAEIRQAYAELGHPAVAVRSSATAEDLPERSFAGQQDTRLDV